MARRGALPEAARTMGLSVATVGRRLRSLEAAVGASLFIRLPNRLEPTPLGRDLAEAGAAMQEGASALARRASTWATSSEAPVRITATGSLSLFLAAHARTLTALAAAEGIAISVLTTKDRLDVAGGEAEIALRMRRLPEAGPLAGRRVGRIAFTVYAARDTCEALDQPGDWRDLGVVGLPETARVPSQSRWLDDMAETRRAAVNLRLGDVALRHRAVQDGAGASLLPCFLGDADPALVRLLEPPPALIEDVHLILHEHGRKRRPVRIVADALARVFRDGAGGLCGSLNAVPTEGRSRDHKALEGLDPRAPPDASPSGRMRPDCS